MRQEFSPESETADSVIASAETEERPGVIGIRMGPYNAALYRRRVELGLSQKQLAQAVGKSHASIGNIETLRLFPNSEMAQKIAEVLGTIPEAIFPTWLQLFTRDRKQPAQVRVELAESEVDSAILARSQIIIGEISEEDDPQEMAERSELYGLINKVIEKKLTPRQRQVIKRRFPDYNVPETLREIGDDLGVSKERVHSIEEGALDKLERELTSSDIVDLLEDYRSAGRYRQKDNEGALMNGVISALQQGNSQRVLRNLSEIENRIANIPAGYSLDAAGGRTIVTLEMLAHGKYLLREPNLQTQALIDKLKQIWSLKAKAQELLK